MRNTETTALTTSKQHFEILDGLRGVASISVVIFHFMEFAVPDYNNNFIAHAYLAVDFFFCLSGFVIAYAYDNRLKELGVKNFFLFRLIRLHPLVVIGSVLGLISFVVDPYSSLHAVYGWGQTFMMFITSCFLIPYPLVHERYFNLFHFNPPTWSLFWEYVANIFYAVALINIKNKVLWILVIVAAGGLFFEGYRSAHLSVGWGGDNVLGGFLRVSYSFLAGILVYRAKWRISSRLGFPGMAILLLIAFLFPYSDKLTWIIDPLFAVLYFPFIVAAGAGATLVPSFKKICRFLGDISYPLYMVHYPFLWILYSYMEKNKPGMEVMKIIIPAGMVLLIGFAWLVMRFEDIPLRTLLTTRLKSRIKREGAIS